MVVTVTQHSSKPPSIHEMACNLHCAASLDIYICIYSSIHRAFTAFAAIVDQV